MAAHTKCTGLILLAVAVTVVLTEELYSSKFDDVNVVQILRTPRLRKQYELCYMNLAPCITPDARFMRDVLPEALVTKCRRCTEKQKIMFDTITVWYVENDPDTWSKILKKAIADLRKSNA